jgi:hypothetical protein
MDTREAAMLQRFAQLATFTLLFGFAQVPAAHASTHVYVQIGSPAPIITPVPVAPPVYSGYVWQPGYYVWTRFGYRWVPGAWVRPAYAPGRWAHERWERERWERDHRDWDRDRHDWDRDRRDWRR